MMKPTSFGILTLALVMFVGISGTAYGGENHNSSRSNTATAIILFDEEPSEDPTVGKRMMTVVNVMVEETETEGDIAYESFKSNTFEFVLKIDGKGKIDEAQLGAVIARELIIHRMKTGTERIQGPTDIQEITDIQDATRK